MQVQSSVHLQQHFAFAALFLPAVGEGIGGVGYEGLLKIAPPPTHTKT